MKYQLYPDPPNRYWYIFKQYILPVLILLAIMAGFWLFIYDLANVLWTLSTPLVKIMP